MKRVVFFLLCIPIICNAQNVELGINAGIGTNTKPSDNMPYKGDLLTMNFAGSFIGLYNINKRWQAGLEFHSTQLSMKSTIPYTTYWGVKIGDDDKKFMYAKNAASVCGVFNGKLFIDNGYGYAGVAIGYGATRHNSKTLNADESYRAPDGGKGMVYGLQVGFVKGISELFAVNAQVALRHYNLEYDAMEPTATTKENLNFKINSFPITLGIRFRFPDRASKIRRWQDAMNSPGL